MACRRGSTTNTDRQTERQAERQTHRHTHRLTHTHARAHRERELNILSTTSPSWLDLAELRTVVESGRAYRFTVSEMIEVR